MNAISVAPAAAAPESFLSKIWNWIKGKAEIVEADIAEILGSKAAADLETVGKAMLETWAGPVATAAIADATDVATGQMSVSKAIDSFVASAVTQGKTVSKAAALQVIALAQNALPTSTGTTVTPVA